MSPLFFLLVFFVDVSVSLRCQVAFPSNCDLSSTCVFSEKQCGPSVSTIRGGMYCSTLIRQENDKTIVGSMDCMYDQETRKTCRNRTECRMELTTKDQQFLHCCCDNDLCNAQWTISNNSESSSSSIPTPNSSRCLVGRCLVDSKWSFSLKLVLWLLCLVVVLLICGIVLLICCVGPSGRRKTRLCRLFQKASFHPNVNHHLGHSSTNEVKDPLVPKANVSLTEKDFEVESEAMKQGRFSRIHRAVFRGEKRELVAVKILSDSQSVEPFTLWNNEKQILSLDHIEHPNILKFYGCLTVSSKYWIVSELCEEGSLQDVLRSRLLTNDGELISMAQQITAALDYLHTDFRRTNGRAPIAHRDLKSQNILVRHSLSLAFCDFGMALCLDEKTISPNEQQQIGTPRYMAPEILAGTIGCEPRALLLSDVYALGLILWELVSRCQLHDPHVAYEMPYESQLRGCLNPSITEMCSIVNQPCPSRRPLIRSSWSKSESQCLRLILQTAEDCWDQNPDVRISASLAARRFRDLLDKHSSPSSVA